MFALVVKFDVLDDHLSQFDALVQETVEQIAAHEAGTLVYISHSSGERANDRIFYECYRDHDAFLAHEATTHTRRFLTERDQHLAAAPQVWRLTSTDAAIGGQFLRGADAAD